ncbi:hypothetical protein C0995_011448 [Termitomyces sp. Mi166|nr:hypothetical protein C0995_011448 [Termitomyces sp. Mi166\
MVLVPRVLSLDDLVLDSGRISTLWTVRRRIPYLSYAASVFEDHTLISTIQVAQSIVSYVILPSGSVKPVIAKVADVTSRGLVYTVVLIFYVVGYIVIASSTNIQTVAGGIILYAIWHVRHPHPRFASPAHPHPPLGRKQGEEARDHTHAILRPMASHSRYWTEQIALRKADGTIFAKFPVIPHRFALNRSIVIASIIGALDFVSFYISFTYLYSYVVIVKPWTLVDTTYFTQTQTVALTVFGIVVGIYMRFMRHYKWFLVVGLGIRILGVGLMIHYRGADGSDAQLVWTQLLQGIGGGFAAVASQVGAQAAVPHADVAMWTAVVLLITEIGGAIGSGIGSSSVFLVASPLTKVASGSIAGAIWFHIMPGKLAKHLSFLSEEDRAALFGSITAVLEYDRGTTIPYSDVMKVMIIVATVIAVTDETIGFNCLRECADFYLTHKLFDGRVSSADGSQLSWSIANSQHSMASATSPSAQPPPALMMSAAENLANIIRIAASTYGVTRWVPRSIKIMISLDTLTVPELDEVISSDADNLKYREIIRNIDLPRYEHVSQSSSHHMPVQFLPIDRHPLRSGSFIVEGLPLVPFTFVLLERLLEWDESDSESIKGKHKVIMAMLHYFHSSDRVTRFYEVQPSYLPEWKRMGFFTVEWNPSTRNTVAYPSTQPSPAASLEASLRISSRPPSLSQQPIPLDVTSSPHKEQFQTRSSSLFVECPPRILELLHDWDNEPAIKEAAAEIEAFLISIRMGRQTLVTGSRQVLDSLVHAQRTSRLLPTKRTAATSYFRSEWFILHPRECMTRLGKDHLQRKGETQESQQLVNWRSGKVG